MVCCPPIYLLWLSCNCYNGFWFFWVLLISPGFYEKLTLIPVILSYFIQILYSVYIFKGNRTFVNKVFFLNLVQSQKKKKELLQDIRSVKIRILTYPNPFFDFVHASKILCNLWGFFWCNLWGYLQYPLSMSTFEWMNKWNLQKKIHIFHTHCFISSSRILSHGVYSLSPKSSCREGLWPGWVVTHNLLWLLNG